MMDVIEIKSQIKRGIANITNVPAEDIADDASFTQDLDLDSLSLLEIGVDVDYEFQLGLPEDAMRGLDSVNQTAELVVTHLREREEQVA